MAARGNTYEWGYPSTFRHKRLVALTGHEVKDKPSAKYSFEKYDYAQAIRQVNDDSQLDLDETDRKLLEIMYNALSEVRRFGADARIDAHKGENPATHSLHSVIELDHVLSNTMMSPERCKAYRQTAGRALLIHDCGEILGEFSTLRQRAERPEMEEDPAAERRILAFALRLAMEAIETGNLDAFYTKIHYLRSRLSIFVDGKPTGVSVAKEDLDRLLNVTPSISAEAEQRVQRWLAFHDLSEMKTNALVQFTPNDRFVGWLAKSVEHVQGTRHMLRMAEKDSQHIRNSTETMGMTSSRMVASSLRYLEGELGHLFAHALSEDEMAIARHQAARTYETARDFLGLVPPLLDRMPEPEVIKQKPKPEVVEARLERERDRGHARRAIKEMQKATKLSPRDFKAHMQHDSLVRYKDAQARLLGMYELAERDALTGRFVPTISASGKGQVIGLEPPAEYYLPLPETKAANGR